MNGSSGTSARGLNVLYISYDGMTDQLGQSQVLPYIVGLTRKGYHFHLISCEKADRFTKYRSIIEKICTDNNIDWHPLPYTKSPPVLSTVKDVRAIRRKALEIHRTAGLSLVHCRGYISSIIGLEMKKKFGIAFLFDMRGLWADEKVDAGTWHLRNPVYNAVYKYFKAKEKAFLENADYTISLTHAATSEIYSWKHIANNPVRIEVIPCCADLDLFNPAKVDRNLAGAIRNELNIEQGEIILTYLGSIGGWYMLEEMLDFFRVYLKTYPSAKFLFISMDHHDLIRSAATSRDIDSDRILIRPALRAEVATVLSICTHSVFFIKPTYSKISSSPTKQAELMGMGIPVICNDGVGDTKEVVSKYGSGITITAFNEQAYENAMASLTTTSFVAQEIRRGAFDYFSLESGIAQYLSVYQRILA